MPQNVPGQSSLGVFAPIISQAALGQGMIPGASNPGMSLLTVLQQQQLAIQRMQAAQVASQADQAALIQMARGLHTLTSPAGTAFTPAHEQAAITAARNLSAASPMLALTMPDILDQLHGRTGSAAGMSVGVVRGLNVMRDRGQYANLGGAGEFTRNLFNRLYSGQSDMNGIRATQAGNMFAEMAERGMLSGATNVDQISRRVRDMSGAISAVRDLFGANGRPNAPMRELFEGLEQLTQGSASWMNPAQMQMQIRRVQALTRHTAGGLQQYLNLHRLGGAVANQLGVHQAFVGQSSEAATAFGIAFGSSAGQQGFGGLSAGEATQLDQRLRLSAANSNQAHAFGALMSLAENGQIQGVTRGANGRLVVTGNSAAANLVRAILSRDQQTLSQYAGMTTQQMAGVLQQSGVSAATASQFLSAGTANAEQIHQYGIANLVRGNQNMGEIRTAMNSGLQAGMVGVLRERGFSAPDIQQFAVKAADAARRALMTMSPDVRSDPSKREERNRIVAEAISREVGPEAAARLGPDGLRSLVASSIRSLEGMIGRDPRLQQFANLNGLISMMSPTVQSEANATQQNAASEGNLSSAMSGLGQGTPLSNVMFALGSAGPGTNIQQIIAQALGGVNSQEVAAALATPASELQASIQEYRSVQQQLSTANPQNREYLQQKLQQLERRIRGQVQGLQSAADAAGLAIPSGGGAQVGASSQAQSSQPSSWLDTIGYYMGGFLVRQTPQTPIQVGAAGPASASVVTAAGQGGGSGGTMQIRGTLTLRQDGNYDLVATPNGVNTVPQPG